MYFDWLVGHLVQVIHKFVMVPQHSPQIHSPQLHCDVEVESGYFCDRIEVKKLFIHFSVQIFSFPHLLLQLRHAIGNLSDIPTMSVLKNIIQMLFCRHTCFLHLHHVNHQMANHRVLKVNTQYRKQLLQPFFPNALWVRLITSCPLPRKILNLWTS